MKENYSLNYIMLFILLYLCDKEHKTSKWSEFQNEGAIWGKSFTPNYDCIVGTLKRMNLLDLRLYLLVDWGETDRHDGNQSVIAS